MPRNFKIGQQVDMVKRFYVVKNKANPSSSFEEIQKPKTGQGYPFPASENLQWTNFFTLLATTAEVLEVISLLN